MFVVAAVSMHGQTPVSSKHHLLRLLIVLPWTLILHCFSGFLVIVVIVTCIHVGWSLQVLQLTPMPALAVALVESFLTMLDAEAPSPLSSDAHIKGLEYTTANTMKMLE